MEKAEYIAQCAAIYKKVVADISDDLANSCAETCYKNHHYDINNGAVDILNK